MVKDKCLYSPIAVDTSGNVYVAERDNNRIQKFDSNDNFITKWGSNGTGDGQFSSPEDVDVDSFGNVHVTEAGNIWNGLYRDQ